MPLRAARKILIPLAAALLLQTGGDSAQMMRVFLITKLKRYEVFPRWITSQWPPSTEWRPYTFRRLPTRLGGLRMVRGLF